MADLKGKSRKELEEYIHELEIAVGSTTNSSERKKAEEALRESEERYRILADRNPHGIQVIDQTGIITYVNPAYQEMLGYTKEELLGKHVTDLLEPASKRPELREYMLLLVKEQPEPTTYYQQNRRNDGEVIEQSVSWNYNRDGEGKVIGFISIITNITERKRAEDALRESEEKYRTIYDNAQVGLYRSRLSDGKMLIVNRRMAEMFGYDSPEACASDYVASEHYVDPEARGKLLAIMREHGKFNNFEALVTKRDGSPIWIQYSGILFPEMGFFEGVATDITERKQAEEELADKVAKLQINEAAAFSMMEDLQKTIDSLEETKQELFSKNRGLTVAENEQRKLREALERQNKIINENQQALAEALDLAVISEEELKDGNQQLEKRIKERTREITKLLEQKQAFISQLAHDLRTPLTPMVALLPMLRDSQEDKKLQQIADMVFRNVEFMEELVNKTIQLAKLNSLDVEFDSKPVNIASTINSILERGRLNLERQNVNALNRVNENIIVYGDHLRIIEVYENLIENALKFMGDGGTLTFDAYHQDGLAVLSIRDTGIGLTTKQSEHIFDEFYKVDKSRHELGSAGLGLSICKRIVQMHGGQIRVESDGEGKGTTFLFTLPLVLQVDKSAEEVSEVLEGSGADRNAMAHDRDYEMLKP